MWADHESGLVVRPTGAIPPRRWVIERTFGWIARCRSFARDCEATPPSAIAFFVLAAAMILVRRLARHL